MTSSFGNPSYFDEWKLADLHRNCVLNGRRTLAQPLKFDPTKKIEEKQRKDLQSLDKR